MREREERGVIIIAAAAAAALALADCAQLPARNGSTSSAAAAAVGAYAPKTEPASLHCTASMAVICDVGESGHSIKLTNKTELSASFCEINIVVACDNPPTGCPCFVFCAFRHEITIQCSGGSKDPYPATTPRNGNLKLHESLRGQERRTGGRSKRASSPRGGGRSDGHHSASNGTVSQRHTRKVSRARDAS